jgi:uncharacterized membrane protein
MFFMNALVTALLFLVVLFLPGLFLTFAFYPLPQRSLSWLERIGTSFLLSLSFEIVALMTLNLGLLVPVSLGVVYAVALGLAVIGLVAASVRDRDFIPRLWRGLLRSLGALSLAKKKG